VSRLAAALAVAAALLAAVATADVPVPALTARVTDVSGVLSPSDKSALERRLRDFEAAKGSQIAVLIVPTTQPETIEQYGIRVADAWKLGRKGVDDGAILVVATDDRALRIEVGYGLEGVMPDAVAKRIIDEVIVPRFKAGDLAGGIDAGVERMIGVVEGEPLPPPQPKPPVGRLREIGPLAITGLFIGLPILAGILRSMFGRLGAAGIAASIAGVLGWIVVGSLVVGVIIAVFAFLIAIGGGGIPGQVVRGGGWGGGGGFGGGGFRGGGGGFGGGGGGFGGGGASGRW
jgi:uncharacterized protein